MVTYTRNLQRAAGGCQGTAEGGTVERWNGGRWKGGKVERQIVAHSLCSLSRCVEAADRLSVVRSSFPPFHLSTFPPFHLHAVPIWNRANRLIWMFSPVSDETCRTSSPIEIFGSRTQP